MSSSFNRLSPPLAAQAAVSSVTALAVERLGEGATFKNGILRVAA